MIAVSRRLTFPAGPILLLAVLSALALFARPLTPIDETRYVSVAWEMWQRNEYLVLFKNGEVVERAAGAIPKAMFKNLVAEHI